MKTPIQPDNAPLRSSIAYRVGTYGDFRETMLTRLADPSAPFKPLNRLRTREPDDPTIALIDAFAAVGDVLTFYQERLANEGYLGTATEPRSLAELARLTGYRPKVGVASSTYLAFTADPASSLTLAAGARAQSVPGPGQTAQSYETSDDLEINGAWNALSPRLTRPTQSSDDLARVFVSGVATNLKANDALLVVSNGTPMLRRVVAVTVQADRKRTVVDLQPTPEAASKTRALATASRAAVTPPPAATDTTIIDIAKTFATAAQASGSAPPTDTTRLRRSPNDLLSPVSDAALALASGATDAERRQVYQALAAAPLASVPALEIHAFKTTTAPFGNRAPRRAIDGSGHLLAQPPEWTLSTPTFGAPEALSIEIAFLRDGQALPPMELLSDAAKLRPDLIESRIRWGKTPLDLKLDLTATESVTGAMPDVGDIVCTLRQLDETGLIIAYAFQTQPVTLRVAVTPTGVVTVVNEGFADSITHLRGEISGRRDSIDVEGRLALVTGTNLTETSDVLHLDGLFDTVAPNTWVAFDAPIAADQPAPPAPLLIADGGVAAVGRSAYGQTARVTRLALDGGWIDPLKASFERAIRDTTVFAGSVPLALADEDVTETVPGADKAILELDSFTPGLDSGRWLVLTGERTDLPGSVSSEVLMLAGSQHSGESKSSATPGSDPSPPFAAGETLHTVLTFAAPIAFQYKRETVTLLGNVGRATQGESVDEILGAGNGAVANQVFTLKKPPLTFVSAVTPSGAASTLRIYVAGVQWQEVASLGTEGPRARVFVTQAGASGATSVRFGDGVHGARLPTGSDNIRARYRSGLGAAGNVDQGAITTLLSRPLGLKSVTNPTAATGGADAEGPDAIRRAAPLGLVSLSRLVAVEDYEDFALTFAGIAKASAKRFTGADGPLVHLTIAGALDDALDPQSDLWTSLTAALDAFGDDDHEVEVAARTAKLALIAASVAVDADRLWSDVEPVIRARLLERFSFARARFGRSIHASDVIATIQDIPGVAYLTLDLLTSVAPPADVASLKAAITAGGTADIVARLARVAGGDGARRLLPAELAYLSDELPDMLVLNEIST